jgi:heptosyltransferase-2
MSYPHILVIRGGAIGDFIMTLPAIGALRERWPTARIEVLGYPHIAELAHAPQYADAIRPIEARALAAFFIPNGILDPAWMDYFKKFNVVLSYLFDPDEIFATNVRRCGVQQYIQGITKPTDLPAAQHYCRPLESLAIYVEAPRPRVFTGEAERALAVKFLASLGRERRVALHPGSGSEKKNWPVEKFTALGRWLMDEMALQLLVVRGEADDRVVDRLTAELRPRPVTVASGMRLPALAAVLERCALFVGNDSGITHLAAAVGTPVVALFGPASSTIWEPPADRVRVVRFGADDLGQVRQAIQQLWSPAS